MAASRQAHFLRFLHPRRCIRIAARGCTMSSWVLLRVDARRRSACRGAARSARSTRIGRRIILPQLWTIRVGFTQRGWRFGMSHRLNLGIERQFLPVADPDAVKRNAEHGAILILGASLSLSDVPHELGAARNYDLALVQQVLRGFGN